MMVIIFLTRPPFPIHLKLSGSALQTSLQLSQHRVSQLSTYCDMYPFQCLSQLVVLCNFLQFRNSSCLLNKATTNLVAALKVEGVIVLQLLLGSCWWSQKPCTIMDTIAKYSQQTHFCSDAQIILFSCQAISIGGTTLDQWHRWTMSTQRIHLSMVKWCQQGRFRRFLGIRKGMNYVIKWIMKRIPCN